MTHPTVYEFDGDDCDPAVCAHVPFRHWIVAHQNKATGKVVPVGSVVLSRQPCKECEGTGTDPDWLESGQPQFDKPKCPSCGGSGTTWPDELIEAVCQGYEKFAEMEAMADVLVPLIELAPLVLDALALVVQEGEAT